MTTCWDELFGWEQSWWKGWDKQRHRNSQGVQGWVSGKEKICLLPIHSLGLFCLSTYHSWLAGNTDNGSTSSESWSFPAPEHITSGSSWIPSWHVLGCFSWLTVRVSPSFVFHATEHHPSVLDLTMFYYNSSLLNWFSLCWPWSYVHLHIPVPDSLEGFSGCGLDVWMYDICINKWRHEEENIFQLRIAQGIMKIL